MRRFRVLVHRKDSMPEMTRPSVPKVTLTRSPTVPKAELYAFAQYDFEGSQPNELSFRAGDLLQVC